MEDIRYRQRFDHYKKALGLLQEALEIHEPSVVERAGAIQFFEATFELAWKLLKDYLSYQGYAIRSPREAIKTAYASELIGDGDMWLEALVDRNLTTHTYDEVQALDIFYRIRDRYVILLTDLRRTFEEEICTD